MPVSVCPITFERAVEVFVRGFCFTRSYTHPYLAERADSSWVMRDAPRISGDVRVEEFVGHDLSAEKFADIAIRHARGPFRLCAILRDGEDSAAIRAGFRRLNFRLMTT